MSAGFYTVKTEYENTIVIEHSKFICFVKGIENEKEARSFIDEIRKKHSLANHNCYAYIADDKGLIQKFSDDGEPQGTAGLPMLEVLKNKRIYKTVAVVTRYFGGIKLGTGGLTRAYSGSVSECLAKAQILNMQKAVIFSTQLDYEAYSRFIKLQNDENVSVIETAFENMVSVKIAVKIDYKTVFEKKCSDTFNGKIILDQLDEDFYAFG